MAYRLVTQVIITGTRILSRSLSEAFKQAQASSQYQRAQARAGIDGSVGVGRRGGGMTLDEACKILNVKTPQGAKTDVTEVVERYKRLFDNNHPEKGGSFYLQSKVVRARERIESEIRPAMEKAELDAEVKAGWKPKIYKDR